MRTLLIITLLAMSSALFAQDTSEVSDTTIVIKVSGITCGGDLPIIASHVTEKEGVSACEALGAPAAVTKFSISYDPSVAKLEDIISGVEGAPSCDFPDTYPYKVKVKKKKK
jgi:hypothetical protein